MIYSLVFLEANNEKEMEFDNSGSKKQYMDLLQKAN